MVKLTMIAETHKSSKLTEIGPFIRSRLDAVPSQKAILLVEGPLLSEREKAILRQKSCTESDSNSEKLICFIDYLTESLSARKDISALPISDDFEKQAVKYFGERRIDGRRARPLESAIFPVLSNPLLAQNIMSAPSILDTNRVSKEILGKFLELFGHGDRTELRILAEFHRYHSSVEDDIAKMENSGRNTPGGLSDKDPLKLAFFVAIIEKANACLDKTAELRSVLHMDEIAKAMLGRFDEIFTVSGLSHVIDLFASPLVERADAFNKAEKEVVLAVDSIDEKRLKTLSDNAKVTVV